MSFLNKILLVLYKHYRKKNDSDTASFHSKGIIVVTIFANFLTLHYALAKMELAKALPIPTSKIGMGLVLLPIFLVINYFTYSAKQLEESIDFLSDEEYKNVKFVMGLIFLVTLGLLFYLPITYGGLG